MTALVAFLLAATQLLTARDVLRRASPALRTGSALLVSLILGVVLGYFALGLSLAQISLAVSVAWVWALTTLSQRAWLSVTRWVCVLAVLLGLAFVSEVADRPFERFLLVAGIALMMTLPANEAVKACLDQARGAEVSATPATSPAEPSGAVPSLKGGRWIGVLERLLLLLLATAGAHVAVGALVAAKGVIRFPEISQDTTGTKAEEFLIGSLSSWTLAVVGALALSMSTGS